MPRFAEVRAPLRYIGFATEVRAPLRIGRLPPRTAEAVDLLEPQCADWSTDRPVEPHQSLEGGLYGGAVGQRKRRCDVGAHYLSLSQPGKAAFE